MKAILVFDVDNIDIENTQATYIELQCNDITIQTALVNHWLKPMPQKKDLREYAEEISADFNLQTRIMDYVNGYNKFIYEILGDNDE